MVLESSRYLTSNKQPVCSSVKGEKINIIWGGEGWREGRRGCVSFTSGRCLNAALFSFLEECSYFSLSVLITMVISRQVSFVDLKLAMELTMTLNS